MSTVTKEKPATTVIIEGRLCFPHLFEPHAMKEGDTKKYQTNVLFPKADKATLKKIEAAIEAAKELGKSKKWGGKIPKGLELPVRDGDEKENAGDEFNDTFYLNPKSGTKPGIVKKVKGIDGFVAVTDKEEVYPGVYAKVSINFYPYDESGSKGVAAGLNNVYCLGHGERLAGRSSAESDFAEFLDDEPGSGNTEDDDDLL